MGRMSWQLFVVALWWAAPAAQAKCRGPWVSIAPAFDVRLPTNAQIVVTLGGESAKLDEQLSATLVGGDDRVPAKTVATFDGMGQREFVLQASRLLRSGRRYELVLDSASKDLAETLKSAAKGSWDIAAAEAHQRPTLGGVARIEVAPWKVFGCGPAIDVRLSGLVADTYVQFEVTLRAAGWTMTYRVTPTEGAVQIGHGMCGGSFTLDPDTTYEGQVVAVDLAGNRSSLAVAFTFGTPPLR